MEKKKIDIEKVIYLYEREYKSIEEISKVLNVSRWVISQRLKENGIKTRKKTWKLHDKKYSVNENVFDNLTEKSLWVLGWFLADGCVIKNKIMIGLSRKDIDVLNKIKNIFEYTGPLYSFETKLKGKIYFGSQLMITSEKLVQKLKEFGISPKKSLFEKYSLKIKEENNENYHKYFIRGIFEGDGSFLSTNTKSKVFQIVGTKELLTEIQNILCFYLKIKPTKLTHNIKNKNHYALRYRGIKKPLIVMDWIYKDATIFMDRKHNLYKDLVK